MADLDKWREAVSARNELLVNAPRDFLNALDGVQARLFRQLQVQIKDMDVKGAKLQKTPFNLKMTNKMLTDLKQWLRDAGYYESINNLGKEYGNVLQAANNYYGSMKLPAMFTDRDLKNLSLIRKNDLNFLRNRDASVIRETYNMVISGIYENRDWRDLQDQLKKMHIDTTTAKGIENRGLLKKYSGTYANTAFAEFDSQAMLIQSNRFNLEYFYYSGAGLKDSRSFCINRRGKVYTKKEIDGWENQPWKGKRTGSSVWVSRGGYNCTDSFSPVSEEMAAELNSSSSLKLRI